MKWLVMGVLGAGALVGVGLAGGLDGMVDRVGDGAVALVRALGSGAVLAPSPPERPTAPKTREPRRPSVAAPAVTAAPVASAAPLPAARIQRSPDGAPGEKLTQDDRKRLNRIIDARLQR